MNNGSKYLWSSAAMFTHFAVLMPMGNEPQKPERPMIWAALARLPAGGERIRTTMGAMSDLVREGKVRHLGISEAGTAADLVVAEAFYVDL